MTTVRIRRARADELDEIADLDRVCFPEDSPAKIDGATWWVAVSGGAVVAYAGVEDAQLYPGCLYFSRIGVAPDFRGQGLHPRLTRTVQRYAKRNGCAAIVTDVINWNPASTNGFIRCGFKTFWPEAPAYPWSREGCVYLRWTA